MGYLSLSFHPVFLHFASPSPIHSVPLLIHPCFAPPQANRVSFSWLSPCHLLPLTIIPSPPSPAMPCQLSADGYRESNMGDCFTKRGAFPENELGTHTHTTRVLRNTPCLPLTVWSNKSFSVRIQSAVYASKPLFYSHGRWVRPPQ